MASQIFYRGCRHAIRTGPGPVEASLDAGGKCPECVALAPRPVKQNVKTDLRCPDCGAGLLLMTRKADGRRFLACSAWYGDSRCPYTSNDVPAHVLAKEAGVPMLPLPGF